MRFHGMGVLLAVSMLAISARAEAQRPGPDSMPGRREALEQRVRQRMAAVVQQRLGLNAEQMRRLGEVNRDMEAQRRQLQEQERDGVPPRPLADADADAGGARESNEQTAVGA